MARVWDFFFASDRTLQEGPGKQEEEGWEVKDVQGLFELFVAACLIKIFAQDPLVDAPKLGATQIW